MNRKNATLFFLFFTCCVCAFAHEQTQATANDFFKSANTDKGQANQIFANLILDNNFEQLDIIKKQDIVLFTQSVTCNLIAEIINDYFNYYGNSKDLYENSESVIQVKKLFLYLYKSGITFPDTIKSIYCYETLSTLCTYWGNNKISKDEFETQQEFLKRKDDSESETKNLISWIKLSKKVEVNNVNLKYGEYHIDEGYFDCKLESSDGNDINLFKSYNIQNLDKVIIKYYIDRKEAKELKSNDFQGQYSIQLQNCILNIIDYTSFSIDKMSFSYSVNSLNDSNSDPTDLEKSNQTKNSLYAFSITQKNDENGSQVMQIKNFNPACKLFISGSELLTESSEYPIADNGQNIISRNQDGSDVLWQQNLSKKYKVGMKGPCGGIIFYDKGNYSDGWRFLEAASMKQYEKIERNYVSIDSYTKVSDSIGSGYMNTVRGSESRAASLCLSYNDGSSIDWFVPSLNELKELFKAKKYIPGFQNEAAFWSSSLQNGGTVSYSATGISTNSIKANVWPIRRF